MKDAQNNELKVEPILAFEIEQKDGRGEDASVCLAMPDSRAALIACLDGCGGSGAKKYAEAENWTGARIASFLSGRTLSEWFFRNRIDRLGVQDYPADVIAGSLCQALQEGISDIQDKLNQGQAQQGGRLVVSSMIRPFPTTLSAALISPEEDGSLRCLFLWAGDSRGFILTRGGLIQITEDDLKERLDPFDNIERDGVLANVISAKPFHINVRDVILREPCVIITATDGCFSYYPSPMEFENTILETLERAGSLREWQEMLVGAIGSVASDDYTLEALACGFETFEQIQGYFRPALERFREQFGRRMGACRSREDLRTVWDDYKQYYLRTER